MHPENVHPMSGCRLPLARREQLDDAGQRTYDSLADPKGGAIRGLRGPGGILLHSPEPSRGAAATWSGGRGSPPHTADSAKAP
jgi:4-carboxymuconolactone decarboxylase